MKNRKLLLIVSLVLAMTMSLGGTLAYLSDTDADVNTMVLGNVQITQNEQERREDGKLDEFTQEKPLLPAVFEGSSIPWAKEDQWPGEGQAWKVVEDNVNVVDKFVTVTNSGKTDAYVRTLIAYEGNTEFGPLGEYIHVVHNTANVDPAISEQWFENVEIKGVTYTVAVYTYPEILGAGETTIPSLKQVYMNKAATNKTVEQYGDMYDILVISQGVQASGFEDAETALNAAFNEGKDLTAEKIAGWFASIGDGDYQIGSEGNKWPNNNPPVTGAVVVKNDAELLKAIQDPNVKTIAIDGDRIYDWGGDSYANSKALLLKGKTIVGVDDEASITFEGYGSANPIVDVTLSNITVIDKTVGDNESSWEHGYLEFEGLKANNVVFTDIMLDGNCELVNCTFNNETESWYAAWVEGGNATFKNCTFTGTRAIKTHEAYDSDVASVVVDNCSFTLSEKPGVVIGTLDAGTSVTIKNSSFATRAGDQDKFIYETDSIVPTLENNTLAVAVSGADELADAVAAGATDIMLADGNYTLSGIKGKTLTLTGAGADTVIDIKKAGGEGADGNLDGSTVVFENLTIKTDSKTYTGWARLNATYNNCTIDGTYALYGNSEFNNCTFNVSGDVYNIWTWGAPTATFNGCTFNSDGKAMLLYGTVNTKLTLNNCVFNDKGGLTDKKAAVEIGNDYGTSYELIVNNTTVNGYEINDNGINTGSTLWANKNSMGSDKLNVVIDGVDVY